MFAVVLGQCSEAMKAKREGQDDWKTFNKKKDIVQLLNSIKLLMLNQQGDQNAVISKFSSIASLFRIRQHIHEELAKFKRRFQAAVDALEHIGVMFEGCLVKISDGIPKENYKKTRAEASDNEANRAEKESFEKLMAVEFTKSAEKASFQEVSTALENMFLKGTDQYSTDITVAYKMLTKWKMSTKYREPTAADGISFSQALVPDDRGGRREIFIDRCHSCGEIEHHAWEK